MNNDELLDGLLKKINSLQDKAKKAEQDKDHKERQLECVALEIIEANEIKDNLNKSIHDLNSEILAKTRGKSSLEREIERNTNKLKRLESSTSTTLDDKDQKKLLLLECLEASGVDNWEWYDEARKKYSEQLVEYGYDE